MFQLTRIDCYCDLWYNSCGSRQCGALCPATSLWWAPVMAPALVLHWRCAAEHVRIVSQLLVMLVYFFCPALFQQLLQVVMEPANHRGKPFGVLVWCSLMYLLLRLGGGSSGGGDFGPLGTTVPQSDSPQGRGSSQAPPPRHAFSSPLLRTRFAWCTGKPLCLES